MQNGNWIKATIGPGLCMWKQEDMNWVRLLKNDKDQGLCLWPETGTRLVGGVYIGGFQ